MNTYTKFIIYIFLKSFTFVFLIVFCLIFILNILSEIEFFRNLEIPDYYPIYLTFLNSPSVIFEMFPFIFLIATQVFFIYLINDNQIQIFKYSGLQNLKIIKIVSLISFFLGILIITLFYNFSSNLKNIYLDLKGKYTQDNKYLAVITKNGIWIKDTSDGIINIINASKINKNFLEDVFISQFNNEYDLLRNIKSESVNIKDNQWIAYDVNIFHENINEKIDIMNINSNFNYKRIQSLFSNLSSLSILELLDLRKNYVLINYSTTEIDLQFQKIISYPLILVLLTIMSAVIMYNTKSLKSNTIKICLGLFLSVIIYYLYNFFNILGKTEKISIIFSVWLPILILSIINLFILRGINEK